ncbi:NAD(P)H-dependent oxidoreductase subunit E [Ideonella sp. 4Y16]|uniref:NAD(P)H-dependent oxidoreductase subunit E n=1 Tax=Ideonella alba TaxID=2824118 RepID=A0A940Y688_9BURK|nr:NAD(P)H-dependent oxidoreductase subunit E [Ideonella alba]MBQ0929466.1 NAD(P)H-dependent oxidoreductase subunit E [Ideonella alba]MBQ0944568.1 NAD(P)H-dependent oxidoreductase subunit E [Ideonella alba]
MSTAITDLLHRHGHRRDRLVQLLHDVQALQGWLPRPALAELAAGLGLSAAVVEGVAGFYRFFHLQPVGRYHLLFADNVTDRFAGSRALAADLCRRLWLEPGRTSEDGLARVGFTSCTGLGDQGPALLLNQQRVITRLDGGRIAEIAELVRAQVPVAEWPAEWFVVEPGVRRPGVLLNAPAPRGEAIVATRARGAAAALDEVQASGLRGRGGAGYPTHAKWRACLAAPLAAGQTRVVVCNADEGEPGTFKDRVLLMQHAHAVFEGMGVAAEVLGARQGLVYLRAEYRFLLEGLQAVLAERRAAGLLGPHFDIEIHLGAGAYVCGEESALIESLEGKRGTPRIRPPFPVERGYLGQPTVVNNVETFAAVAWIARHGAAAWAALGTPESRGSKLHSVSGDVSRPGVYELPFGTPLAELLREAGAHDVQAVQLGGPSGLLLAPPDFERRLGFEDLPTAGALMVFNRQRDLLEVVRGFAQFFAHESCGFCTPCRVGTELVVRRLDKLHAGHGSPFDERELRDLEALMHGTTHCGLGASATNPLRDLLQRFPEALRSRSPHAGFVPGFDLDAELASARAATGRDDRHAHLDQVPR